MTTESKVYIGGAIVTGLIMIGAIILFSKGDERLNKPLLGQKVQVSAMHVSPGTKVSYNSNPPAGGEHYGDSTGHSGFYDTTNVPADGYLVHSLEHGAVILWYNPKMLSKDQVKQLTALFNSISLPKTIMTPRDSMDVPVAITSWGQILKLKTIDEKQIKNFFETNYDRGPEQAPI